MFWRVVVYIPPVSKGTYDGNGARGFILHFDDEPSAHRFALNIVEAGPADSAGVERVEGEMPVELTRAGWRTMADDLAASKGTHLRRVK